MRALLALMVWVGLASPAAAQTQPSTPAPPSEPAASADPEVIPDDEAAAIMAAEETLPRYGLALGLNAVHPFAPHLGAGLLGFSAAFAFAFKDPTGIAQLGVSIWPDVLRADRSGEGAVYPQRSWEYFVGVFVYPFDFDSVHLGFYIQMALASFTSEQARRVELGPSVLWSISECCGLHYQLGFAMQTNLANTALVSSLDLDVMLF